MEELKGKRLLVLGGSIWKKAIKDFANEHGIYLISAGLYPAGIDEIAEESYRIDTTDGSVMKPFVKEHCIDGVYMGGSELIISSACQYVNEIGLPCYCTRKQWDFLQNKRNFKDLCIEFGLPVVPKYEINEKEFEYSISPDAYPVITKPADGCGSNGFSVCRNIEELKRGYVRAAEESPNKTVICEKFVRNDGVVVFYTLSEGKLYFSGLEDKIPVKFKKQGTYVGGLFLFKSRFTEEFRDRFEKALEKMFQAIGLREGSIWIEVFHDNNDYYFNEVGFRYGGSVSIYPVCYLYGYNQVAADIYYALTGRSKIEGHRSLIGSNIPRKKHYGIYPVYLSTGTIREIESMDVIANKDEVVFCTTTKRPGSIVPDSGSFNQCFALIHFVFDTVEECSNVLYFIHSTLKVYDETGKDIVLKMLDFNLIEIEHAKG